MTAGPGPLLAFHAHPDDETLATGALLATWAAAGAPVTVVTCTRGERGEVIPPALAHLEGDGPALAAHRERELAAALAALGVADHAFLDALPGRDGAAPARYEDSGMVWLAPGRAGPAPDAGPGAFAAVPVDEAAARLATLLRARRPAVVVTDEPGGGYGHPDHVQGHRVAARALALAADPEAGLAGAPYRVPVVLWSAVDADQAAAAERALPAAPPGLRRAGVDRVPPSAAVPGAQVDLRVDAAAVLDRVAAALRAHATQVQAVATWDADGGPAVGHLALSDGVLRPILRHEAYRLVGGALDDVRWPVGVGR